LPVTPPPQGELLLRPGGWWTGQGAAKGQVDDSGALASLDLVDGPLDAADDGRGQRKRERKERGVGPPPKPTTKVAREKLPPPPPAGPLGPRG